MADSHHSVSHKFIIGDHTQEQNSGCHFIHWNIAKYFIKRKDLEPSCHLHILFNNCRRWGIIQKFGIRISLNHWCFYWYHLHNILFFREKRTLHSYLLWIINYIKFNILLKYNFLNIKFYLYTSLSYIYSSIAKSRM